MLNRFLIEEYVKQALIEDIGFGDITTDNLVSEDDTMKCTLNSRTDGVFCGRNVFKTVFEILDKDIEIKFYVKDGDEIKKGDKLAEVKGSARAVLTGERTALNYIQRMSGIATETRKYQKAIEGYKAKIVDTRKTTPCFRVFEKYSVKVGCGHVHRFNLSDCAMIKDNHVKFAGSLSNAINILKKSISHAHKIEVECDTLAQVEEALNCGVDIIMLDNMTPEVMKQAVALIDGRAQTECSGNITKENIARIREIGVDFVSSGALTHSAPILDISMKNLHAV